MDQTTNTPGPSGNIPSGNSPQDTNNQPTAPAQPPVPPPDPAQTQPATQLSTSQPSAAPAQQPQQQPVVPPQSTAQLSQQPDPNAYLTEKTNPEDLSSTWRRTKCLNCNYVYEGTKVINKCPKCGNTDPDKFEETD